MPTGGSSHDKGPAATDRIDDRFAANDVRLSPHGWLTAVALTAAAFWLIPLVWQRMEPLDVGADYRVPYRLGNDYWNFERACRQVCRGDETLLIGDSVLWGHYVDSDATLSHYLNGESAKGRFANLGIDGIHPVALSGLIEQYAGAIRNKRVIVNCNLLWISSPRHDLSSDKESPLNHPALAPQFALRIPCYRASISDRLGIVVARHFSFLRWADHMRIAYFDSDDLATWTQEHPYENPLSQVTLKLPSPDEPPSPQPDARPWDEKGLRPIDPEWVPLEASLQWRFFRRTVELLKDRGNRVFVIIGPLNEHMLTPKGLTAYTERKLAVAAWHSQQGIPHAVPAVLPSAAYADLSHPTAEGNALLAKQLMTREAFREFVTKPMTLRESETRHESPY
jgi:hypothetical protein